MDERGFSEHRTFQSITGDTEACMGSGGSGRAQCGEAQHRASPSQHCPATRSAVGAFSRCEHQRASWHTVLWLWPHQAPRLLKEGLALCHSHGRICAAGLLVSTAPRGPPPKRGPVKPPQAGWHQVGKGGGGGPGSHSRTKPLLPGRVKAQPCDQRPGTWNLSISGSQGRSSQCVHSCIELGLIPWGPPLHPSIGPRVCISG